MSHLIYNQGIVVEHYPPVIILFKVVEMKPVIIVEKVTFSTLDLQGKISMEPHI